jgi:NADPH:quinone reductase
MRRWIVESFGTPADVWRLDKAAEEFEPGTGQVKVEVEAAGLGLPDVLMCNNNYPLTPPLPFTPSQEAAGKIVAVGENVDGGLIGSRVLGPTLFQAQRGGLAQYCLMQATSALPIPNEMTGIEAAGFYIPYQTAWVALVQRAKITADDTVLILGASGSSGAAALQLAKAKGARVIAVAGGPEKSSFCASLGADVVIDRKQQDVTTTVLEATDGNGVSLVFDPVGGKAGRAAFKALGFEGRFLIIGYASGEWAHIELVETLMKNISLLGAMPVGYSPQQVLAAHEDLLGLWREGFLKVADPQVFDFGDARAAIEHIAAGKVEGKVVINLQDGANAN